MQGIKKWWIKAAFLTFYYYKQLYMEHFLSITLIFCSTLSNVYMLNQNKQTPMLWVLEIIQLKISIPNVYNNIPFWYYPFPPGRAVFLRSQLSLIFCLLVITFILYIIVNRVLLFLKYRRYFALKRLLINPKFLDSVLQSNSVLTNARDEQNLFVITYVR